MVWTCQWCTSVKIFFHPLTWIYKLFRMMVIHSLILAAAVEIYRATSELLSSRVIRRWLVWTGLSNNYYICNLARNWTAFFVNDRSPSNRWVNSNLAHVNNAGFWYTCHLLLPFVCDKDFLYSSKGCKSHARDKIYL